MDYAVTQVRSAVDALPSGDHHLRRSNIESSHATQSTRLGLRPAILVDHLSCHPGDHDRANCRAALRAAGDARSAMLAMVLTNVVNIFVSYWLVSGNGPFPKIGWEG